jgi:hypothetical protein
MQGSPNPYPGDLARRGVEPVAFQIDVGVGEPVGIVAELAEDPGREDDTKTRMAGVDLSRGSDCLPACGARRRHPFRS